MQSVNAVCLPPPCKTLTWYLPKQQHFHLTNRLLPILESSGSSRVVVVSSSLHKSAPQPDGIRFSQINDPAIYKDWTAYAQSKLANILFARELNKRLEAKGVKNVFVNACHPGVIRTELGRHIAAKYTWAVMWLYYMVSPHVICKLLAILCKLFYESPSCHGILTYGDVNLNV
jgi:NAD(P)-dependent dehydrogenase (short-subunit alcohol dehydrogenase family)